ncbi:MAG: hypothetical protein RLZZ436_3588, partial [Planctomycetota bacterium]
MAGGPEIYVRARKTSVALRTLVRTPARGVSIALQAPLPAGCRQAAHCVTIAFAEIMSGRAEAPGCASHPGAWPLPAASTSRFQGTLPAGFRQAAHCVTIAFAEIMSGRAEAPGCDSHPGAWPLPAASTSRFQGTLPAGCRQA